MSFSISGAVFEDVGYGGGPGRSRGVAEARPVPAARVELYSGAGALLSAALTAGDGSYRFAGLAPGSYLVRVVNGTVASSRTGYVLGLLPVQTFRADASSGAALPVTARVGGEAPSLPDAGSGTASLAGLTTATSAPQSVAPVMSGGADVAGLDFGFSFNVVVNTNDAGQGSLRQLILNANALGEAGLALAGQPPGADTSIFMIPGPADPLGRVADPGFVGGRARIAVLSSLPRITGDATRIDGLTQTASLGDTNPGALSGGATAGVSGLALAPFSRPEIELVAAAKIKAGLELGADGVAVRGLAIVGFGSEILIRNADGALVEQNILGSTATDLVDPGPGARADDSGIYIAQSGGGTLRQNLIAFHDAEGVLLDVGTDTWLVEGNEVRQAALASSARGAIGVAGNTTARHIIRGNHVSSSCGPGLLIDRGVSELLVTQNTLTGGGACGGGAGGALVAGGASDNLLADNSIGENIGAGVVISGRSEGNALRRNAIFDNTGPGIDLGGDGPTANDGVSAPGQPNQHLDHPVLITATLAGSQLTVAGFVGLGPAAPQFAGAEIELFLSDGDPDGRGEGRVYLGALVADGVGSFSGTLDVSGVAPGDLVTAVATDSSGNSSEYGPQQAVAE